MVTEEVLPSVPSLVAEFAVRGNTCAVATPTGDVTYAELDDLVRERAAMLAGLGVRKGTVIALLAPNGIPWIVTWLAAASLGAVLVPMNTFSRPAEVIATLRHSGAHLLIAVPEFMKQRYRDDLEESLGVRLALDLDPLESLPQLTTVIWLDELDAAGRAARRIPESVVRSLGADVEASDPLTIVYTTGSTGSPKGIVHSHGAVLRQAHTMWVMTGQADQPTLWTTMPLNWVGGLTWSFLRIMVAAGSFVTQEVFDPAEALALMMRAGANEATAWGPVAKLLVEHPAFDADVLGRIDIFERALGAGDPQVPQSLGMTETLGPHSGWSPALHGDQLPAAGLGSLGRALPGMQHRVIDPATGADVPDGVGGELLVRGSTMMLGRHRFERREVFDAEGWYHTGDKVIRRDGFLFLVGRLDDMIKTAGANVSPAEVVAVLVEHESVDQAFVTSMPDGARGEAVVAFLVPSPLGVDIDEVRALARHELAVYKVPRHFGVLSPDEVPWTPTQKVDYQELRRRAQQLFGEDNPS